jgi:hypothetical protein
MSENRVLRKIFGRKKNEIRLKWAKLLNEEFQNLNFSQNIIPVIKSERMKWAGHMAFMGKRKDVYGALVRITCKT